MKPEEAAPGWSPKPDGQRVGKPEKFGPFTKDPSRLYVRDRYPAMVRNNRLRASRLSRLRDAATSFGYKPLISVVMPVYDPGRRWLERALDSVLGQAYPGWQLCVCDDGSTARHVEEILSLYGRLDRRIEVTRLGENAGISRATNAALALAAGEFVTFLDHDDELAPDALFEVVRLLQDHPETDLVYSDVDKLDDRGERVDPHFKPGWSPDLLMCTNYLSHLSVYRRSLVEEIGGLREGLEGAQDYDLALRFTERTGNVRHIPRVLYHWRMTEGSFAANGKAYVPEKARLALSSALERRGIEGSVEDGLLLHRYRVRAKVRGEPRVSIIIPTRDNAALLKTCVESIERRTTYTNYEILILDNDSAEPETVAYLAASPHRVVPFGGEFNYSEINNFGVSRADGEYVLFLNDDTEVIERDWLEEMLGHAQRPEVGAVGAKLLYPDGRVQHAGVVTGVGHPWGAGVAVHAHQHYSGKAHGYMGAIDSVRNYSAVTAACMLLRRSVFDEAGGFDPELRVSFNDVDLCLRIRERGYNVVYTPHARLYHHESASRGYVSNPEEVLFMRRRWGHTLDNDPYYNPNFSAGAADFNLRADLLRPRGLEDPPPNPDKHHLEMQPEELRAYMEDQRARARSSFRTTLLPRQGSVRGTPAPKYPRAAVAPGTIDGVAAGPRAEQLVWIFGSPRTGSTWLSKIMAELPDQVRWNEPYVGMLFGSFLHERVGIGKKLLTSRDFIAGEPYQKAWLDSMKNFVLDNAAARYPALRDDQHLVVKEPNGSIGASLLMQAMPESRMIFLIRDPRDVISSQLDAFGKGGWTGRDQKFGSEAELLNFTRHLAERYERVVSLVREAHDRHAGHKALVRYEDLRRDTLGTLRRMYEDLGIRVDEERLRSSEEKHRWENVPAGDKGSGKFYRKALPGGWREDLSPKQVEIIEDVTEPVISGLYQPDGEEPGGT